MQKGTNAHPQYKSEYQLRIHLNILVHQDKLDVIMHPPSGQKKTVAAHPTQRIIYGTALKAKQQVALLSQRGRAMLHVCLSVIS